MHNKNYDRYKDKFGDALWMPHNKTVLLPTPFITPDGCRYNAFIDVREQPPSVFNPIHINPACKTAFCRTDDNRWLSTDTVDAIVSKYAEAHEKELRDKTPYAEIDTSIREASERLLPQFEIIKNPVDEVKSFADTRWGVSGWDINAHPYQRITHESYIKTPFYVWSDAIDYRQAFAYTVKNGGRIPSRDVEKKEGWNEVWVWSAYSDGHLKSSFVIPPTEHPDGARTMQFLYATTLRGEKGASQLWVKGADGAMSPVHIAVFDECIGRYSKEQPNPSMLAKLAEANEYNKTGGRSLPDGWSIEAQVYNGTVRVVINTDESCTNKVPQKDAGDLPTYAMLITRKDEDTLHITPATAMTDAGGEINYSTFPDEWEGDLQDAFRRMAVYADSEQGYIAKLFAAAEHSLEEQVIENADAGIDDGDR